MSKPYNVVQVEGEGCTHCGMGNAYDIVGPDGVALSHQWVDSQELGRALQAAQETELLLNDAFAMGNSSTKVYGYIAFSDQVPNSMQHVLAWNEDINHWERLLYMTSVDTPESLAARKLTHWMREPPSPFPPAPAVPTPPSEVEDDGIPF